MQLMHEHQHTPFAVSCALAVVIGGSVWLLTHFAGLDTASANAVYWRLERAAGVTSYGLLFLTTCLGLTSASALWDRWNLRKVMTVTHQYAALLVLPFLLLHLWGLYMDNTIPFTVDKLLIPLRSSYRPVPTALGALALYLWVSLIATSYFRERLGTRTWRTLHGLYLPLFLLVTLHGLLSGTDTHTLWAKFMYVTAAVVFAVLVLVRRRKRRALSARPHLPPA